MRLAACLGMGVDLIEPLGFVWSDRRVRRAGMDYINSVDLQRHASWQRFADASRTAERRLVLLTTSGATAYTSYEFVRRDVLILGRESAGVTDEVRQAADISLVIPMVSDMRSLNVATAAAIVAGEACRQLGALPSDQEMALTHA